MNLESYGIADSNRKIPGINALLPDITILKQTHDQFANLNADAYNLGHTMSNAFSQMIIYGRGFKDSLTSLLDLFGQFILKTYVFNSIASALGGGGNSISGVIGTFFGGLAGGKAGGGPVSGGSSYLVGERGPEIFTPGVSGNITPNGAGGGIYIDARGADGGVEARVMRGIAAAMRQSSINGALLARETARRT
jgi:hypothetical protein